ncbi:MAG: hypothetical protein HYZ04_06975 [Rhodospirillales bacterium]|nr:hypothetical protein [Rhodospirillales bacterium]
MSGYLGNFLEHWGQVTSLAAVAAVWLGFAALGAVVGGRDRVPEATPIYGWAVVSFAFTVVGVLTSVPFTWLAAALAALAVAALVTAFRKGDRIFAAGSLRIATLALPLTVLTSAMVGSQWDEFGTWLMIPRRLLELDRFPDHATKLMSGTLDAYPYGWHVVSYLASRLAGRLVENAGGLVNVLLLLSFGLMVVRLIQDGRGAKPGASPGWALLALGGLAVTAVNPTFAQKVVLTAYADVATAVCIGFGGVLGWRMLDALARGAAKDARRLAFEVGLVMLVLVNLKQATVVLFALVIGAIVLAGLRDPNVRARDLARLLPAMTLPGIAVYVVWRYYVATELTGAEASVMPIGEWLFAYIPEIVWRMIVVLSKKGLYLALMAAAATFAVRSLLRFRTPFDRLAIITGAIFLGYNAFLLFVYVSTFGKFDALRAASLWRYNMHLGPIGVAFAAYGLAILWARHVEPRLGGRPIAWLPIVLILLAPLVFANKLRFDRHPPVPFFRDVGRAVAAMVKPGDRLFVVDPTGTGESGVITRFELTDAAVMRGYIGVYHPHPAERFREIFKDSGYTHILVHSTVPTMRGVIDTELPAGSSHLLERDSKGGWTVVRSWKVR